MRDTLHWLPVRQRIHYRLSTIVWLCALGIAPTYLLELFILTSSCNGRQSLRSGSRGDFVVPHDRTTITQHRAFAIVGRGVQYVHWVMHKCIMVKVGGKRNTRKVCKKQVNLSKTA